MHGRGDGFHRHFVSLVEMRDRLGEVRGSGWHRRGRPFGLGREIVCRRFAEGRVLQRSALVAAATVATATA